MPRLSIEIEREQHRQIKTLATFSGLTIKDYILSKTLPQRPSESDSSDKLLSTPKNAKRLRTALKTPSSKHVVFESLSDLEDALGI